MGYSADEHSRSAELVITDVDAVWAALLACEDDHNGQPQRDENGGYLWGQPCIAGTGHISWCNRLSEYQGTTAEKVKQVLSSYGFDDSGVNDDGHVEVGYWGGDKIGSCWDGVTDAIARGITEEVKLIMCGEDGEMWGTILIPPADGEPGHAKQVSVTITLND